MEATMYFVLGVLSIIAVAVVAVVVWGMFKIISITKTIKLETQYKQEGDRHIWESMTRNQEEFERRINVVYQAIDESRSYTDRRIDKLMDSQSAKKLIKD